MEKSLFGLIGAGGLLLLLNLLNPRTDPLRGPHGLAASSEAEGRLADTEHLLDHGVQGLLGHGSSRERLERLEGALTPIFVALPKVGDDVVNQAAASYALHRYFASSKAWTFKELTPSGKAASPLSVLKSRVPDVIADVLEAGMRSKPIRVQDLAMLAATVEDLVHGENIEVLMMAYRAYNFSILEPLTLEQQALVLEAHTAKLLAEDAKLENLTDAAAVQEVIDQVRKGNPIVEETLLWVNDLVQTIRREDRMTRNPFAPHATTANFVTMARVAEEVLAGIGRTQNSDCATMKRELLELEDEPAVEGAIELETFHEHHLANIGVPANQAENYMKYLSAIDTRDPLHPRAIVSNYVYASAMCLPTPGVLKLCCINECNALMEGLERIIAQPAASPELVASAVASLESTSVAAPRVLSGALLRGLDRIAAVHGGQVPLHSKGFARWMHRAFPIECPDPNVPGALHAPWVGEAYVQSLNTTSGFMSAKTATRHAYDGAGADDAAEDDAEDFEAGAADAEELKVVWALEEGRPSAQGSTLRVAMRTVALFALVVASGFGLARHFRAMVDALGAREKKEEDLFI